MMAMHTLDLRAIFKVEFGFFAVDMSTESHIEGAIGLMRPLLHLTVAGDRSCRVKASIRVTSIPTLQDTFIASNDIRRCSPALIES